MDKTKKTKIASVLGTILIVVFMFYTFAYAAPGSSDDNQTNRSNVNNTITIPNPIGSRIDNIPAFIFMILGIVFKIGAIISVLALMYVGFMFVSARGEPEKLEVARRAFLYTVIGIAVLLGGVLIASVVQNTVIDLSRGVI